MEWHLFSLHEICGSFCPTQIQTKPCSAICFDVKIDRFETKLAMRQNFPFQLSANTGRLGCYLSRHFSMKLIRQYFPVKKLRYTVVVHYSVHVI